MDYPNCFEEKVSNELTERINKLTANSTPQWGKMNVGQMFAHVNVAYNYANGKTEIKAPRGLAKFMMKKVVKPIVCGPKPYKKNNRTAKEFIVPANSDFEQSKKELLENIRVTSGKGTNYWEGKENPNFGTLTANEWNTLYYKHLDHHLKQFGV